MRGVDQQELDSHIEYVDKLASEKASLTGLPYQDLRSAARYGLVLALKDYEPDKGTKFSTFVYRCAQAKMADEIKFLNWGQVYIEEIPGWIVQSISMEEMFGPVEAKMMLEQALKILNFQELEVIKSRYFQNNSIKEIGQDMKLSEPRASKIHTKALAKLREVLCQ